MKVDPKRQAHSLRFPEEYTPTGVSVRAELEGFGWDHYDVAVLDRVSLLEWLRSRGGDNPYAEDFVGMLLNHGPLHRSDQG